MNGHKSGCMLCGAPLVYSKTPRALACAVCGGIFQTDAACAPYNFRDTGFQVRRAAAVSVGGEQDAAGQRVVLRAVHMTEGQVHHPPEDGGGVGGGLSQA